MARVLVSHQCGRRLILVRCHMWVEFLVGSRLALRVFSGFSGFPPSTKANTPNSNSTWIEDPHENQLRWMWLPLLIFIYLSKLRYQKRQLMLPPQASAATSLIHIESNNSHVNQMRANESTSAHVGMRTVLEYIVGIHQPLWKLTSNAWCYP